ncbi:MAG: hypothetical protein WDO14_08040 [Bacteroidota bacterium]
MKSFQVLLVILVLISCGKDKDLRLVINELNTSGIRHTVFYKDGLASCIRFETFHGSGTKDTTAADSAVRREIDSVKYDLENMTALLTRLTDEGHKDFRKYYFNSDNLLTKITRFDGKKEYVTDSVRYDYTSRSAFFYDVINKHVFELVYDTRNNIESETEKRVADQHVYQTFYYYYDASRSPFLVNLDSDEELFGCFNYTTVGLFWNNASRPVFSSVNNVQSFKEVAGKDEHNGLYEYQYRQGLPAAQFGTNSVIYYNYLTTTE